MSGKICTGIYILENFDDQTYIAVRETDVCQHHGDLINSSSETPRISQHYCIEGFKGGPQLDTNYAERHQFPRQPMQMYPVWS